MVENSSAFQPFMVIFAFSWGFAPDWYDVAPLALRCPHAVAGLFQTDPLAQSFSA
jgi:hypothetical protein